MSNKKDSYGLGTLLLICFAVSLYLFPFFLKFTQGLFGVFIYPTLIIFVLWYVVGAIGNYRDQPEQILKRQQKRQQRQETEKESEETTQNYIAPSTLLTQKKVEAVINSSIFYSKKFWIVIGIIFAIWFGYKLHSSPRVWTPALEQEATQKCLNWGGEVISDQDGHYHDCFINSESQ